MSEKRTFIKRSTAFKVLVSDIVNSSYFKEDGSEPNYIMTKDNRKISRVNFMGAVIAKETDQDLSYRGLVVDDGTSSVSIRIFDDNSMFNDSSVGDIVLVIGKPRLYGSEIYVVPEIIKKEDIRWLELRKLELGAKKTPQSAKEDNDKSRANSDYANDGLNKRISKGADFVDMSESSSLSDSEKMLSMIKASDNGDGAAVEELVVSFGKPGAEQLIEDLLSMGDIFMIKPGKVKIL